MMQIDKAKFFDGYRHEFGPISGAIAGATGIVHNLEFQLDQFATDPVFWTDLRHVAYALATQVVETTRPVVADGKRVWAPTFGPGYEVGGQQYFEKRYGYLTRKGKELGNDRPGDGYNRRGRGYVQLTGKANDRKMQAALKLHYGVDVDLLNHPELAMDPLTAFRIMSIGMHLGSFTGRKLANYITGPLCDYTGARRIINGQDRAGEIAKYAVAFERILIGASAQ